MVGEGGARGTTVTSCFPPPNNFNYQEGMSLTYTRWHWSMFSWQSFGQTSKRPVTSYSLCVFKNV